MTNDGAHPLTVGVGVLPTTKDGKPQIVIIEPPSEHAIRNRHCVVFDEQGHWALTAIVCEYVRRMRPTSIEVAALFSNGPTPKWVNYDYVCFETPADLVVSGLGIGYNKDTHRAGCSWQKYWLNKRRRPMNAADRSGPNLGVLADSVLNETPLYPFACCPENGYIASDMVYTDTLRFIAEFGPESCLATPSNNRGYYMFIAFCLTPKIAVWLRRVLRRSIASGGSTISDYVQPDGSAGRYQDERRVYGGTGEACRACRGPIRRVVIGQGSSHYCPRCQR